MTDMDSCSCGLLVSFLLDMYAYIYTQKDVFMFQMDADKRIIHCLNHLDQQGAMSGIINNKIFCYLEEALAV